MAPDADPQADGTDFEAILAPVSFEQFLDASYGKAPLHLSGASGRFRHLLDWDDLARLLQSCPLEPPRLSIFKRGAELPRERYLQSLSGIARIDGGRLSLLLDEGATVILNHIDDLVPPIAAIADEIGDRLSARTAVNLYASWRSEPGFAAHWDSHDVIVLQLAGRKTWSIYKPSRPNPLGGDQFEAPPAGQAPDHDETLEDGDVLYLPRGWIHAPLPLGEPSLHLTISVTRPTGAGFLAWLAEDLHANSEIRASFPVADERAMTAFRESLAAIVGEAINQGAVDRYLASKDAERGARPQLSFPDFGRLDPSDWDEAVILRPASQHRIVVETGSDGGAQLTVLGRAWPCSAAVASSLARMTSTRPLTLGELEEGLGEGEARQLRQYLTMFAKFGMLSAGRS